MTAADLVQFPARALQATFVEIDRGHARAGLRKTDRDGAADAAAPARSPRIRDRKGRANRMKVAMS